MESSHRISRPVLAGVFLTAVAVTALDDAFALYAGARQMRHDLHRAILDHTATAPDHYRVLVPYVVEGVIRVLSRFMSDGTAFDAAYAIFYLAGFALLLGTLYAYLRTWFTETQALIAALAAAS